MTVDWMIAATIAAPVVALFVGVWVNRRFESRPLLISYFGHVSSFRHTPPGGQLIHVHTHSVVLRNAGRVSATNVRLRHGTLPSFQIWPEVVHRVEDLPAGALEIVIPTLVPGEQVTISYLYFPPLTFDQVNAGIKSDHGFAQAIPVLLQRQYPCWAIRLAAFLIVLGVITVLYVAYEFLRHFLA
ncbi:MAG TPA: hypothetical protein VI566_14580 [Xanthomonadales bacterium]|nr:hypothetical protein [Xanthomonadales bacterium]